MIYTDKIAQCIRLLEQGVMQTEPLPSGLLSLEQGQTTLENFSDPYRMKTLVRVTGSTA